MVTAGWWFGLGALLALAGRSVGAPGPAEVSSGDSLRVYHVGEVLVSAPAPGILAAPGVTTVPESAIERQDAGSLEGVAQLVPAARVGTNSRGETLISVRNAGERQLAVFHDGIPLNAPWDERIDVSLIPAEVVGGIRVTRGIGSVLDGPNAVGGTIQMLSRDLGADGQRTRVVAQGGESRAFRAAATHLRRFGAWGVLAGVGRRSEDGFLLPAGQAPSFNQTDSRVRLNSDLRETSLFLRVARDLPRDGSVGVVLMGNDAVKGVPPETHLADGARYWRYGEWRRGVAALQGEFYPDTERRWRLQGSLSLDLLDTGIDQYADSTYAGREGLEEGEDRTVGVRLLAARRMWGEDGVLAASLVHRSTAHDEIVTDLRLGDPEDSAEVALLLVPVLQEYAQTISAAAMEWSGAVAWRWRMRVGAGYDVATTPESGDKPDRGTMTAPAASVRFTRILSDRAQLHFSAARRSRFPALREMYSGALGRFKPNPDLEAETQTTLEVGGGVRHERLELAATLVGSLLEDGIVRISVEENGARRFQRVNQQKSRTLGLELAGAWVAPTGQRIDAHYAILPARVEEDGEYRAHAERAAEYTGYAGLSGPVPGLRALSLLAEVAFTGPQWSLDAEGRMARLASYQVVNLRGEYAWSRSNGLDVAPFVRVNNILDVEAVSQIGLPARGREVRAGLGVEF